MMRAICPPRPYPGLKKPIGLMEIDFPTTHPKVFARYPFLRSTPSERRRLFAERTFNKVTPILKLAEVPAVPAIPPADRHFIG
jgi:hypothetical protein